ncbi:DUF3263 domain-containing protein [Microbacterium sp. G2-8]|uniref:DUF3263 domain-containing protein n=1 Tax=Microbacterium sp. G2-8 TaxID=2842454 RepID=UPI001C89359F|nr:DUF3263 domain-containing protein [Microbacterium sp. G2-8]
MSDVDLDRPRAGSDQEGLDGLSRAILAFETEWPKQSDQKERAMRERLELEPVRYYQLLGRLVDDPAAQAHAPMLIGRLRRLREARAARRARLLR